MSASPLPLSGDEIREGIAERIKQEVLASLRKTCSLNHVSFPKFTAKWWVEYELDDWGRPVTGAIGGQDGEPGETKERVEGVIEAVPPDKFRRDTQQPVPVAPQPKPKPENSATMSQVPRGAGRRREV